jgi:hypothetical protein
MSRLIRTGFSAALVLALVVGGAEAAKAKAEASPGLDIKGGSYVLVEVDLDGANKQALRSAWTQYGPDGVLEARAIVEGQKCPVISLDLRRLPMAVRAAADDTFSTICTAEIPQGTKQAALAFARRDSSDAPVAPRGVEPAELQKWARGLVLSKQRVYDLVPLPVPVADPQRILVIGDGGCRSKGDKHQDCSKPESWPFAQISAEAAKLKPDLIIHVGDFVSREQACPADVPVCQNQPFGDNWAAWDADTFTPMKPLFAVAPIMFARGNHEDCHREGLGYLRLLAPTPFDSAAGCIPHLPPYAVPFANLNIVVSDNSDAPEPDVVDASVPVYREEIANLAEAKAPVWWVQHRPIWGLISGPLGIPAGGNKTLAASVPEAGIPAPVELMLSGHIHTFEAINYKSARRVPPQLLAGRGGDMMDPTPKNLRGAVFQGSSDVGVKDGISVDGFGYTLMTKVSDGWRIDVYDWQGRIQRICQFHNGRIDCPVHKR